MELVAPDEQVDVAKLPDVGVGIEHRQAEALEQHGLDVVLAQQLHRRHQNLLQVHLVEQVGTHACHHLGEHFGLGLVAVGEAGGHIGKQGRVAVMLGNTHHTFPIHMIGEGGLRVPKGGTKQGEILGFGGGHSHTFIN